MVVRFDGSLHQHHKWVSKSGVPEYVHTQSLNPPPTEGYVNRFPSTQLNKRDGNAKIGYSDITRQSTVSDAVGLNVCVRD